MANTHIELVKEYLAQEAEVVTFASIEEDTVFFNITQDNINFEVMAYPFYDEDDNIKGYEVEYKEEGQSQYRGNGTLFLD